MVYRPKGLRFLGITQFAVGTSMLILAIASFAALDHWSSYIACGIWVGLWVGLTGLFAYLGAKSDNSPNNCLIGMMIGFAVTSCVLAGVVIIVYSIAVAQFADRLRCPRDINQYYPTRHYNYDYNYDYSGCFKYKNNYYGYYSHNRYSYSYAQTGAAIGSLMLMLGVLEFFLALALCIYGCNACCCTTPTVQAHQQVAYVQQPNGNVIVINPHGVPTAATVQTISTYQGQVLPVIQGGQPQTFVGSPQGIPQQGQGIQPYRAYPATSQATGVQQPQQAFQAPQSKQGEMPPPYNFNG